MSAAPDTAKKAQPEHFVSHIQGLRAIAVLLVVIFHFWPGRLTGGYIGVDVFFVISGFLITGQLVRELRSTNRIGLATFWAKRVRRLMPAAILVLAVSALATAFILPLSYLISSLTDISTSLLYVENWHLVANSADYLNSVNSTIGEHYWSLSVEEQFYIVWPLALLGAFGLGAKFTAQRRWRLLFAIVGVILLLSFVASIVYTRTNPAQAYFVLFTRMWEFGAGAVLVFMPKLRPRSYWLSNLLGLVGIAILAYAGYKFTQSTPFPGYWALVPVIGTLLIIMIKPGGRWWNLGRLLSIWPMRFLGDISYSLYLWHWPLIFVAPFIIGWGLGTANRIALFVGCFVIAWLTKRFVEDPMRKLPALVSRKPRYTFGWMAVAFGVVALLIGGIFGVQNGKYQAAQAQLQQVQAAPPYCFGAMVGTGCTNPVLEHTIIPDPGFGNADAPNHPECFVQLNNSNLQPCTFGSQEPNAPRVALVGDSHGYQYINAFIALAAKNNWSLTTYFKGACPWTVAPVSGADPGFVASCTEYRNKLGAELNKQHFNVIVTAAFAGTEYVDVDSLPAISDGFAQAWQNQSGGARIVAIADNPDMKDDPNKCLRSHNAQTCAVSRNVALPNLDPLAIAARNQGYPVVDFTNVFCPDGECLAVIGGADVYRDADHLTATFASTMGWAFASVVNSELSRR
jgi:peptidoglycan/LPS O-acetylase OafA/YrhL